MMREKLRCSPILPQNSPKQIRNQILNSYQLWNQNMTLSRNTSSRTKKMKIWRFYFQIRTFRVSIVDRRSILPTILHAPQNITTINLDLLNQEMTQKCTVQVSKIQKLTWERWAPVDVVPPIIIMANLISHLRTTCRAENIPIQNRQICPQRSVSLYKIGSKIKRRVWSSKKRQIRKGLWWHVEAHKKIRPIMFCKI